MLQDLFPRDHRRYEGSRFGAELEALNDWLAAQGHLRHPLRLHLHRVRNVHRRMRPISTRTDVQGRGSSASVHSSRLGCLRVSLHRPHLHPLFGRRRMLGAR
jgi:hypothetical protein